VAGALVAYVDDENDDMLLLLPGCWPATAAERPNTVVVTSGMLILTIMEMENQAI
jgi:hypothetical protein